MVHDNYTSFKKMHKEDQMRYLLLFGYFICGSTKENRSGPWLVKTSHKSSELNTVDFGINSKKEEGLLLRWQPKRALCQERV